MKATIARSQASAQDTTSRTEPADTHQKAHSRHLPAPGGRGKDTHA
jgi:hypothetical protein